MSGAFVRRIRIERVFFGFYGAADARVGPAAEALRNDPLHAAVTRRGEQMVGSHRAQTIAACEAAIELAQVRRAFQIA